jgi:hypothetical protein
MLLWESESKPKTLGQIHGHDQAKQALQVWLKQTQRKPALVHGASGIGKTSLCMALVSGYTVWDDSMLPEGDNISDALDILLHRKSLCSGKRAIVIDLEGLSDRTSILKQIKGLQSIPILLTCDDIYDFSKEWKTHCEVFALHKPSIDTSRATLLQCMKRLDVPLSVDSASMVLEISQGNVRNALNTLQFMVSTKKRKRQETSSQLIETSFTDKGSDLFSDAQRLCCGYLREDSFDLAASDSDMSMIMLQNNLASCVPSMKRLADSLDHFSQADILTTQFFVDQSVVQTVLAAVVACKGSRSTRLQFPTGIMKLHSARIATQRKLIEAAVITSPTIAGVTMGQLKPTGFQALENLHVLRHVKHKEKDVQALRKGMVKQMIELDSK